MISLVLVLLALTAAVVQAKGDPAQVIITYDWENWEMAEGIAIDKTGNIFVSHNFLGELRKIDADGVESLLADFQEVGPLGLAVDAPGNVYVAHCSFSENHGVYRVAKDGTKERLPGTENIIYPNALAFDKRGNLYVTDTVLGAIWKVPRGGVAELWLQHELLVGLGLFEPLLPPVGANGISYRKGQLYVANTERSSILRVPILKDGGPGDPEVVAEEFPGPPGMPGMPDGIALDVHGNIYVAVINASTVLRIDPADGSFEIVATVEDDIDYPTSLAFGTGKGHRQSVFVTNYPLLWDQGFPVNGIGAAIVRVDVGEPGLPLP
jgi:sugar lactone lactonase YvrE